MTKNSYTSHNDEIDLTKVIYSLWNGKWKILVSTIIAFIITLVFIFLQPKPSYNAITDIKPINSIIENKYAQYNFSANLSLENPLEITSQFLLSLYVEEVEYKKLFTNVIKDLDIFKKSDYETEKDYNDEINKITSNIKLLFPYEDQNGARKYHQISFSHTDKELWKKILTEFHKVNQEFIRNNIIERFIKIIEINDYKNKVNISSLENQYTSEKLVYDLKTKNYLLFLQEQSQLARTLGIKSNTLKTQVFDYQNFSITNIDTESPYYLRGYESIEKEIDLIKSRKIKENYVPELVAIEKKKYLAQKKDETIKTIEKFFFNTPIKENENFEAVSLNIAETKYKFNNIQKYKILTLAIFVGLFVGVIYVLLSSLLQSQSFTKKDTK